MKQCKHPGVEHGKLCPTCKVYVMRAKKKDTLIGTASCKVTRRSEMQEVFRDFLGIDIQPEEPEKIS